MENLLNPYDKQCMRMAILKHEETFREQVYELHRLYQIQKILMKNTASSRRNNGQEETRSNFKDSTTTNHQINDHLDTSRRILQGLDLERPAEEYNHNAEGIVEMADSSQLELTLGPSSFYRRRKEADASPALPSDNSGPSFSSSSCASSHIKRNTGEESSSSSQKWRLDMPMAAPGFLGERKKSSDVEEPLRQDRINNNPPWLFQVLSLNMT